MKDSLVLLFNDKQYNLDHMLYLSQV